MKRSTQTPDSKGLAAMRTRANGPGRSHLAHWPPPNREHVSRPVLEMRRRDEPAHRVKRGWRLTRAMFSEFEGEDE